MEEPGAALYSSFTFVASFVSRLKIVECRCWPGTTSTTLALAGILKLLSETIEEEVPALLMSSSTVSIGKAGMQEGHQGVFSLFLKSHGNGRLFARRAA